MIYYTKEEVKEIKSKYSNEEFQEKIYNRFMNSELEYPWEEVDISEEIAKQTFNDLLHHKPTDLISLEDFQYASQKNSYKYKISNKIISEPKSYNNASNYFHKLERFKARGSHGECPYFSWKEKKLSKIAFKNIFTMLKIDNGITSKTFEDLFRTRSRIVSQFKPVIAKWIYSYFKAENVLDLSSGWGDRLCGFFATKCCKHYTGIDPNPNVQKNYIKQIPFYQRLLDLDLEEQYTKDVRLIQDGSENVDYESLNTEFDLIFTSPPYFNVEVYNTEDKNQCYLKYNNLDSWFKNYLEPTLSKSWKVLKEGGFLVLNISDNWKLKVCDRMNDFISTLENAKYQGTFNMKLGTRVFDNNRENVKTNVEPMWIWRKTTSSEILEDIEKDLTKVETVKISETLGDW